MLQQQTLNPKVFFPQTRDIQLPLLTKLSTANVTFPRKRVRLEAIVKKKKKGRPNPDDATGNTTYSQPRCRICPFRPSPHGFVMQPAACRVHMRRSQKSTRGKKNGTEATGLVQPPDWGKTLQLHHVKTTALGTRFETRNTPKHNVIPVSLERRRITEHVALVKRNDARLPYRATVRHLLRM